VTRRKIMMLIGGAAAARPLAARSQQAAASRRVDVLMGLAETDPFTIKYVEALRGALKELGWIEGQNIQFVYRYAGGDPALARTYAKQLVEFAPDTTRGWRTLQRRATADNCAVTPSPHGGDLFSGIAAGRSSRTALPSSARASSDRDRRLK
jgi:hypothetical protein